MVLAGCPGSELIIVMSAARMSGLTLAIDGYHFRGLAAEIVNQSISRSRGSKARVANGHHVTVDGLGRWVQQLAQVASFRQHVRKANDLDPPPGPLVQVVTKLSRQLLQSLVKCQSDLLLAISGFKPLAVILVQ